MTDDKKPLLLTRGFRQAEWRANLDFCVSLFKSIAYLAVLRSATRPNATSETSAAILRTTSLVRFFEEIINTVVAAKKSYVYSN